MAAGAVSRRVMLCGGIIGAGLVRATPASAADAAERDRLPQPGDFLVSADDDTKPVPLRPADLAGQDIVLAWAFDPVKKAARDGSRLNMVLLMKFDPSTLGAVERPRAADGVVAYSAICTHAQCTVAWWLGKEQVAECPCHQSRYDLRNGARVVGGPAPRPLPGLPLRLSDGKLQVAAEFTSRVGGEFASPAAVGQ